MMPKVTAHMSSGNAAVMYPFIVMGPKALMQMRAILPGVADKKDGPVNPSAPVCHHVRLANLVLTSGHNPS
ncbi:hypothetical protein GCM10027288_10300 [Bordetella tumbae]